jgi:hypothetical protein
MRMADAIAMQRPAQDDPLYEQWHRIMEAVSYALIGTNGAYDRQRFMRHCRGEK